MKLIRSALAVLTAAALAVTFTMPASAASTKDANTDPQIQAALVAAGNGQTTQLDALLAGPKSAQTQVALRDWLTARGQLTVAPPAATSTAPPAVPGGSSATSGPSVGATATASTVCGGKYECFCVGYNGVSMGWYNKIVLACHGYLDQYISGGHSSHSIPDLFPRNPGTVSITLGCAVAAAGTITTIISLPATGGASAAGYGWAKYGAGVLLSGAGLKLSCP